MQCFTTRHWARVDSSDILGKAKFFKTNFKQEPMDNPEPSTPILGLWHRVFMNQFIFKHILGHFFPQK